MVVLYEHPLSPYAQKNKIALREKDIPFELITPDAFGSGDTSNDFLKVSPRGEVPTLVDDDIAIFDSTIILEYIEDNWPTPPLLPTDAAEGARVRMIEDVMDTHMEAINWGLGEIFFFKRAEGKQADEIIAKAAAQTQGFFTWLEAQLGTRGWFNGDAFGWGDLSVIPYVNGAASFGNLPPEGSRLHAWAARMNARPSVAQTASEAAASVEGMTNVADIVAQGLFKREYRDHRLEWMVKTAGLDVVAEGLEKNNIRFSNDFS
ncbi:MAG: glutathione S-transferase family protein [Rhodobiaceae bacterium]|nr:glutathione S-transferase family protein [Rhodobiaceae bacterium]